MIRYVKAALVVLAGILITASLSVKTEYLEPKVLSLKVEGNVENEISVGESTSDFLLKIE